MLMKRALIGACLFGISCGAVAHSAIAHTPSDVFNVNQKKSIENIVHNYLIEHPDILIEMSNRLKEKIQNEQPKKVKNWIAQHHTEILSKNTNPMIGNPSGHLVVLEFFDYQCAHCKNMTSTLTGIIKNNTNLRVIFYDWPIFGGDSNVAARAALAAKKQNQYVALHDALLAEKSGLTESKVMQLSKNLKINTDELKKDMDSLDVQDTLKKNAQLAEQFNLMGTPVFVVINQKNGTSELISGEADQNTLQAVLDRLA